MCDQTDDVFLQSLKRALTDQSARDDLYLYFSDRWDEYLSLTEMHHQDPRLSVETSDLLWPGVLPWISPNTSVQAEIVAKYRTLKDKMSGSKAYLSLARAGFVKAMLRVYVETICSAVGRPVRGEPEIAKACNIGTWVGDKNGDAIWIQTGETALNYLRLAALPIISDTSSNTHQDGNSGPNDPRDPGHWPSQVELAEQLAGGDTEWSLRKLFNLRSAISLYELAIENSLSRKEAYLIRDLASLRLRYIALFKRLVAESDVKEWVAVLKATPILDVDKVEWLSSWILHDFSDGVQPSAVFPPITSLRHDSYICRLVKLDKERLEREAEIARLESEGQPYEREDS